AAITYQHVDVAVGQRHADTQPSGDFVAHAAVAVLHVIAVGALATPVPVQLARQAARGADNDSIGTSHAIDRTEHLGITGKVGGSGCGEAIDHFVPAAHLPFYPFRPVTRRGPATQRLRQSL